MKVGGVGQPFGEHALVGSVDVAREMADSIVEASSKLRPCPICFSLTEEQQCNVCSDPTRDHSVVCVVEEPADVLTLEQSGQHRGAYHVLGGILSPIDNVGPDDLHVKELLERAASGVREVIIATNPTVEGEATALYLVRELRRYGVLITRLAMGLPVGSDLDFADQVTIKKALEGRTELKE